MQRETARSSLEAEGRRIVEQLGGTWRPGGGLCRCPAHDDRTPSLSVRPGERRLLFHCFAGCDAGQVLRALDALKLLASEAARSQPPSPTPADPGRRNRDAAQRLWAAARPLARSPAETYLGTRGLASGSLDLRYHARTPCGRGATADVRPAMLAAVRDDSGLVAVHRTFLDPGSGGLARFASPKRALGPLGEGAVRLAMPEQDVLGLAEGIETALAATLLTGIACWATLGSQRFARVAVPPGIRRLILFLDHDAGGRRAEMLAREAFARSGRAIEARYAPRQGADWNDVLLDRKADASTDRPPASPSAAMSCAVPSFGRRAAA